MGKLEHLFLAALFVSGLLLFGCSSGSNGFQITTDSLPNATINVAYSQTLTASGGAAPYTWTIISGMLPTGLTLISSTGVISGTPTSNGTYPFTVKATDATNATATKPLSITVGNSGSGALQITTTSLPAGTVGNSYNGSVQATGGNTPYTWSIISGALPAGLQLDSSNGAITGTPTASGTANFTVQVQDSNSATDSKALSITVNSSSGGSTGINPSNGTGGTIAPGTTGTTPKGATIYCPTSYDPANFASPVICLMNLDISHFQNIADTDAVFIIDTNSYNDVQLIFERYNEAITILINEYNIDMARIYFAGWSAGGNICLLYLTDPQYQQDFVAGIMVFPGSGGNTAVNNCNANTGRKSALYYAVGDQDTSTGYYPGCLQEASVIASIPGYANKVETRVWAGQGHMLSQDARDEAWAWIKNFNVVNN